MELKIEDLPGGIVLAVLNGRMDIDGALAVDQRFSALGGVPNRRLVIDMSDVSFVASMGLRTLMMCAKSITQKGGKAAIANPQPNVLKVLETSGVTDLFSVSPSREAAAAAVAA